MCAILWLAPTVSRASRCGQTRRSIETAGLGLSNREPVTGPECWFATQDHLTGPALLSGRTCRRKGVQLCFARDAVPRGIVDYRAADAMGNSAHSAGVICHSQEIPTSAGASGSSGTSRDRRNPSLRGTPALATLALSW
jgi:hypothetical protein